MSQPTFININGTVINLNQVAAVEWVDDEWSDNRFLRFRFTVAFHKNGNGLGLCYRQFEDTPAVRKAWDFITDKTNINTRTPDVFTFTDKPETEPTS